MPNVRSSPAPERDSLFQHLASVGHALSSPQRLRMLGILAHKERTVEELAGLTNQSVASTSAHLKPLRAANLIRSRKEGRFVHLAMANAEALKLWLSLRDFGTSQLPEAREFLRQFNAEEESIAPLPLRQLVEETKQGRAILLDLRPRDEYEAGHLPGAVNLPYPEFRSVEEITMSDDRPIVEQLSTLSEASAAKPVYAYCRGPFCLMAREGVALLRKLGIPVRRLLYSMPEWAASH